MWMIRIFVAIFVLSAAACGHETEMDADLQMLLEDGSEALASHQFQRALALADSALMREPELPEAHFLRGWVYSEAGRYSEAEASYRAALEHDPEYRGAWHNLGNNAYRQHEFRSAIRYYEKELEHHPAPAPWQSMGRAYREIGLVDSALYAYEQALTVDSTHIRTYVDLTQLLDDEGDVERAVAYGLEGHEIAPENIEIRYMVGSILVRAGRPARAVPHLQAVAEEWPWHHSTFYNLGRAHLQMGREEQGKRYLDHAEELRQLDSQIGQAEKAVRNTPNDPAVHVKLGRLLRIAGRYDEALHAYGVALQLDPGNRNLINNISGLHMAMGRPDEALRLLERMLDADPDYVEGWLNLGITYAQLDSQAAARNAWETALRLEPDNEAARENIERLEAL